MKNLLVATNPMIAMTPAHVPKVQQISYNVEISTVARLEDTGSSNKYI